MTQNEGFVVAVVAIVVRGDRVLAMRRSRDRDAGAGVWETLSGRVEVGEQPVDAVVREIAEECALEVQLDSRPIDTYTAVRAEAPMLVVAFRAEYRGGEVRRSREHDAHEWCSVTELEKKGMPPRLLRAVRRALDL